MDHSQPNPQQAIDAVYAFAAEQMHKGIPDADVQANLVARGLHWDLAVKVVADLAEARGLERRDEASNDVVYGGLWCLGGLLVTALTYSSASNSGGTYVVAWGAILFGALQFLRGVLAKAR